MISQNEKTIDFTPESAPLRRSVWLIFLAATAVLLFFLGRNALLSNEGNFAEGIRQIVAQQDIFSADNWWVPTEKSSLWFCRGRSLAAEFFGCQLSVEKVRIAFNVLFILKKRRGEIRIH